MVDFLFKLMIKIGMIGITTTKSFTFSDGNFQVPPSLLVLVSLQSCLFSTKRLIGFRFEMGYLLCPLVHIASLPAWTLPWHCCVTVRTSFCAAASALISFGTRSFSHSLARITASSWSVSSLFIARPPAFIGAATDCSPAFHSKAGVVVIAP